MKIGRLEIGLLDIGPYWVLSDDYKTEKKKIRVWLMFAWRNKSKGFKVYKSLRFSILLWVRRSHISDELIKQFDKFYEQLNKGSGDKNG